MSAVNVQNVTVNHVEIAANGDWALIKLVDQANKSELEIEIQLNLGGVLLSGRLVGGHKYFSAMQRQAALLGDSNTLARDVLANVAEEGRRLYTSISASKDDKPPEYIHLLDVQFFETANTSESEGAPMWRGKIVDVTGFHLRIPNSKHITS